MPANNPFSDAINSVIQEYERHRETTKTKKVPKGAAKPRRDDTDPIRDMLTGMGINVDILRRRNDS